MAGEIPLYDRFSGDYDVMVDWQGRLAREWPFFEAVFARALPAGRRQRVLDVGCGTGAHALHFAHQGCEVVAADPSGPMLEKATARAQGRASVGFVQAGFGELGTKTAGDFDVVTCLGNTLPHALDRAALAGAIGDIAAILRPGGQLIIQQLNYDRICAARQRFLGLTATQSEGEEVLFFRFYDYLDPLVRFNVVILRRPHGGSWSFTAEATMLRPVLRGELDELLAIAGFRPVEHYGAYDFAPFDSAGSNDLVVIAQKRADRPHP